MFVILLSIFNVIKIFDHGGGGKQVRSENMELEKIFNSINWT